jgi:signal transduction histidine kinase
MSELDPRWPKVLSLTVHELRTPLTVVLGYIRMLLTERAGAISDQQRRLLEEAEKSCNRLSGLVSELSELSNLEGGTLALNRQKTDVRAAIRTAVAQLPPLPDREIAVELRLANGPGIVDGDPVRLAQAFGAVVAALRREIVTADRLTVREVAAGGGFEFHIGDDDTLDALADASLRPTFDEWRGGVGLSLAVARRLIEEHGGHLWGAPAEHRAGARVLLPSS